MPELAVQETPSRLYDWAALPDAVDAILVKERLD